MSLPTVLGQAVPSIHSTSLYGINIFSQNSLQAGCTASPKASFRSPCPSTGTQPSFLLCSLDLQTLLSSEKAQHRPCSPKLREGNEGPRGTGPGGALPAHPRPCLASSWGLETCLYIVKWVGRGPAPPHHTYRQKTRILNIPFNLVPGLRGRSLGLEDFNKVELSQAAGLGEAVIS